jgi:hypothetical protein
MDNKIARVRRSRADFRGPAESLIRSSAISALMDISDISDFGFEVQDSSNFEIFDFGVIARQWSLAP